MHPIGKKVLTDQLNRPVAVQIDYADWLEIESLLDIRGEVSPKTVDLSRYVGVISLGEDPLEYQTRIRGEWR